MGEWVSTDQAAEDAFIEAGKPVLAKAAELAGWAVEDIRELHPNGMGPRTNARVFHLNGQFMDIKLPAEML